MSNTVYDVIKQLGTPLDAPSRSQLHQRLTYLHKQAVARQDWKGVGIIRYLCNLLQHYEGTATVAPPAPRRRAPRRKPNPNQLPLF